MNCKEEVNIDRLVYLLPEMSNSICVHMKDYVCHVIYNIYIEVFRTHIIILYV